MFRLCASPIDRLDEADTVLQVLTDALHVAHGYRPGRPMDDETWASCSVGQAHDYRAMERLVANFEEPAREAFKRRLGGAI